MVAASASASLARCVAHKTSASGSAKSAFAGKPVAPARAAASRARRAGVTTRAVVTPPQTHDNARPDTTLRPVSAAAVDSSKALEQFRSMGGASREFISRIFSASERARTGGRGRRQRRRDPGSTRARHPGDPARGVRAVPAANPRSRAPPRMRDRIATASVHLPASRARIYATRTDRFLRRTRRRVRATERDARLFLPADPPLTICEPLTERRLRLGGEVLHRVHRFVHPHVPRGDPREDGGARG